MEYFNVEEIKNKYKSRFFGKLPCKLEYDECEELCKLMIQDQLRSLIIILESELTKYGMATLFIKKNTIVIANYNVFFINDNTILNDFLKELKMKFDVINEDKFFKIKLKL